MKDGVNKAYRGKFHIYDLVELRDDRGGPLPAYIITDLMSLWDLENDTVHLIFKCWGNDFNKPKVLRAFIKALWEHYQIAEEGAVIYVSRETR